MSFQLSFPLVFILALVNKNHAWEVIASYTAGLNKSNERLVSKLFCYVGGYATEFYTYQFVPYWLPYY